MNSENRSYSDQDQLFADYYHGRLDEEAAQKLEARLETDAALAAAYDVYVESVIVIESLGVRDLMKEVMEEAERPKRNLSRYLIGATAVAASILLGFFIFRSEPVDHSSLFDTYFKSYPNLLSTRQSADNRPMAAAMDYYVKGDFAKASELLKDQPLDNDTTLLYLGTALLGAGQTNEALNTLSEIKQNIFTEASTWYQALGQIRLGNTQLARALLKELPETSTYADRAKALLAALE